MPAQLGAIIGRFVERHNNERIYQSLGYETPADRHLGGIAEAA